MTALELGSGWRSWIVTITLGLLLGGAVGNFIDRIALGYVVDFADIGIGNWRFYIFNIADSAVTAAILLMLGIWIIGPFLGIHLTLDGQTESRDNLDRPARDPEAEAEDARAGAVIRERRTDGEGR